MKITAKKAPMSVRASKKSVRQAVRANEEIGEVEVAEEATELLFETEDVAELLAEATGEDVTAEVVDDAVEFTVGEDTIVAEPEGDEEILESRSVRGKKSVRASRRAAGRRPMGRRVARR